METDSQTGGVDDHLETATATESLPEADKPGKPEPRGYKGWFFTWNNPTMTPDVFISTMKSIRSTMGKFQLEKCPSTGTLHFQGGAQWHNQMRGSTLTKRFPGIWLERLHDWNMVYGTKDSSRVEGPWAWGCVIPRPIKSIAVEDLYPWQRTLFDRLKEPCIEDRKVLWCWEPTGCAGKSSLAKTLRVELGEGSVLSLDGDAKDMYYAIRQIVKPIKGPQLFEIRVVVFDFERTDNVPYDVFGKIKDGWIFSPKYESTECLFPPVHVVCFANFPPDTARVSTDRWEVIDIRELST